MSAFSRSSVVVLSLVLSGWFRIASGQRTSGEAQQGSPETRKAPRVTLAGASGTPGSSAVVPIYFAPGEGVEVGQLRLEITFVSRNLKFARLARGTAAELGNVNVRHELREEKSEQGLENSTLTIVASAAESANRQKGIPGGLLAYITLKVNEGAGPANITLRTAAEGRELASGDPLESLEVMSDHVEILAPGSEPLVSCFFFSH